MKLKQIEMKQKETKKSNKYATSNINEIHGDVLEKVQKFHESYDMSHI